MKGAIVTEPMLGLHSGFITCISVQEMFDFLRDTNSETKVTEVMCAAIESGMFDRKPTILYCDVDTIYVKINATELNSAVNESKYICSLINYALRLEIQDAVKQNIFPFAKTLYIADEIYFKAKKRYIAKLIMYKNTEIKYPIFKFTGYKINHIEDLLNKDI